MRRQLSGTPYVERTKCDPQPADRSHEVWALATTCGYVVGAASVCPSISEARIAVTADRMSEMLALYPDGTRQFCASAFEEAFAEGKASIANGELDEGAAEQALCSVARMLGK